jgi:transcriptional regulator with XRE-family HTH domain
MKAHWTARSVKDYLFRIAADFIAQLENKMESLNISQDELAKKLGVTKGRVSQLINHPGNISLAKMIEYAKALGMKVSIVAYEDNDPENKKGPIDSEIFRLCWENSGKPRDFWAFEDINMNEQTFSNTSSVPIYVGYYKPSDILFFPFLGDKATVSIGSIGSVAGYVVIEKATSLSENFQKQDALSLIN